MKNKFTKEEAHNNIWLGLLDLCDTAKESGLGVPHIVFLGIQFFTQLAVDCAPNEAEGRKLVKEAAEEVKPEKDFEKFKENAS